MNGDGREGPEHMSDQRADGDIGTILETWMEVVAPSRAPDRLLEESFARTMVANQRRAWPWHALRGAGRGISGGRRMAGLAMTGIAAALTIAVAAGLVFRPGGGIGGGPTPSPSSSRAPSSSPPASSSPFPSPIVVQPTAIIPVAGAAGFASDGTSIWLFTVDGKLIRIDALTNSIAASVAMSSATDAYQALAGDRTGLWVTDFDAGKVFRFDPQTLRPTATIDPGGQPKGVLVTTPAIWVANTHGGSVVRIDPKTNKVVATLILGPTGSSGPGWLASGFGSIWVGVPNIGAVVRINATTNAIQATIPIAGPASPCGGLAAGTTAVWITSCDGSNFITQIDPVTNSIVATIDAGGRTNPLAMIEDHPWTSVSEGQIVRLDAVSHAVDRVITPGPDFSGGGDVVVAAGSLWVNDWKSNRVLRLSLADLGG